MFAPAMAVALATAIVLSAASATLQLQVPGAQTFTQRNSSLASDAILDVAVSPDNEVWVATERGITIVGADGGLRASAWHGNRLCHRIVFAPDGGPWIHCGPAGLSERKGSDWSAVTLPASGYSIMDIAFDAGGRPWVATNLGLFARVDGEWRAIPTPPSGVLKLSAVSCVARSGDALLAHVSLHGVVRFDVETLAHETIFPHADTGCPLAVDRAGIAWFATRKGLYRLGAGSTPVAPFADIEAIGIAFDAQDRPWVSARDGAIRRHDGSGWIAVAPAQRLRGERFGSLALAFDRDGTLWAGGAITRYFSSPDGTGLLRLPRD